MEQLKQSKIFWIFFSITFVIGLFVFSFPGKKFQSQMDLLLIPKSKITAKNADKIQNDVAQIILSLNFYDQLLDSQNLSTELSLGRNATQRKSDWNDKIEVIKSKNSNILSLFAYDADKNQAELLSQKVARQISDTMSQYYDIRTDLEIRIIDGPLSQKMKSFFDPLTWILSLLGALACGTGAFLFFNSFAWEPKKEKLHLDEKYFTLQNFPIASEAEYVFPIKEDFPQEEVLEMTEAPVEEIVEIEEKTETPEETFPEMFSLEEFFPEEKIKNSEEIVAELPKVEVSTSRTASAPTNLPIAENSNVLFSPISEKKEEKTSQEEILEILEKAKASHEPRIHEATPEEVKARLNRLLKGEKF